MEKRKLTIGDLKEMYQNVKDFWVQYEMPWKRCIDDLDLKGCELSSKLIREEFDEYVSSVTNEDALDAIVDLLYVSLGAMMAAGLGADEFDKLDLIKRKEFATLAAKVNNAFDKRPLPCTASIKMFTPELVASVAAFGFDNWPLFKEAWYTVHKANMSKYWTKEQLNKHESEFPLRTKPIGLDLVIVWRKSDGKLIKPPDFRPPNLTPFIK